MTTLSLDYQAVLASLHHPLDAAEVGAALLSVLDDRYRLEHQESALHEFEQLGATYLFDLASSADLPQEDRTVAAWALTPAAVAQRDSSYQRGFPLAPHADEAPVDRGHVIPHLSGGEFRPNIFRQDRALNRGWSQEGKRYRVLEREAAATPGPSTSRTSCTTTTRHTRPGSNPGILPGSTLHVERFRNRPRSG